MTIHIAFDLLAWLAAAVIGVIVSRSGILRASLRTPFNKRGYMVALGAGAVLGAILLGSINLHLAGRLIPGHSIAGAIAGGIVAVETYKSVRGIRGSTGLIFVAPLAAGIAIGRLGCFFAGLPDFTYGVPTALPWGVDFGDGIPRHPVQLYESLTMLAFLVLYFAAVERRSAWVSQSGFYLFVLVYALQRFTWEFLKPYPTLFGPLNVFHLVAIALTAYALVMIGRRHEFDPSR